MFKTLFLSETNHKEINNPKKEDKAIKLTDLVEVPEYKKPAKLIKGKVATKT